MKYSSKSVTNVGLVRSANEDNLGEAKTPNGDLFVVCDGMGGHVGGAQASSIAVNSIIEYFQREVYDNVIQAMDHALSFANEQIYASALNNPDLKGMGTTAVLLLIRDEECFIGHVGDSRIYLRSNGKLNRITKDHSFVQTLVDSGVIDDEDAENHPNKNQILQALGIAPSVKATICQSPILPKAGDMFLLCSDGLNGMVNDRDIEHIMQEDNLMVTSENLITAALNGGGHDNVTASLILIDESTHTSSRFVHFNPKPKVIDMTSTQQFGGGTETSTPKKSKLPYYIGGSVLLLGACIAVMMLLGKEDEEKEKIAHKKYTLDTLKSATDCENVVVGDSVEVDNDTIIGIKCKSDSLYISIESKVIVSIKPPVKSKGTGVQSVDVQEEPKVESKNNNKELNQMNDSQVKQLKIGSTVNDKNGVQIIHNHKITIKDKKIEDIIVFHTVQSGQGLSAIVKMYKSRNKNLTETVVAQYNQQHGGLTEDQKTDIMTEKHNLTAGSILEIPLKGNK